MMERLSNEMRGQIRQFDSCTQQNKNCIRFDSKSGLNHKLKIIHYCEMLLKDGADFFTRARLKENEACADVYVIPVNQVVEFRDSESDESIERKRKLWESRHFNFVAIDV